jgi:nicotinate (nicotinamide) nucleotide adenylyltransferase
MDPTLAPGYVPPNNTKIKSSKGHHWAEVQKTKEKAAAESGKANGTATQSSSPLSPNRPRTADSGRAQKVHPKMAIWRAGRSAVSDGEGIGGPADLEEVPIGLKRQALRLEDYTFPEHRLRTVLDGKPPTTPPLHILFCNDTNGFVDDTKEPLIIVACGSYSPVTYLHLRLFEMAADAVIENTNYEIMGGFFSPVSDSYLKPGLVAGRHRVRMCELACERTSNWLMVDAWEALQPDYSPTARVLDHFEEEINGKRGGVRTAGGAARRCKIMLLAGGDLITSMGEPGVWADADLEHILGRYGCIIVERTGSDVWGFLLSHDILYKSRKNIVVIKQLIYNDISSTKVRYIPSPLLHFWTNIVGKVICEEGDVDQVSFAE